MKNKLFVLITLLTFIFIGCSRNSQYASQSISDSSHIEFISPLSIGRLTPISISFMDKPKCPIGEAVELFPKMKGVWEYTDNKATFIPDEPYKGNSKITLKADLAKLFQDGSEVYERKFFVENPSCDVTFDEVRLNEKGTAYTTPTW